LVSTIDLHIHTFYSDGRDPPEIVLRRAAALGIKTVAIADHDNTSGVRQVQPLVRELGQCLIPAIELACRWVGTQPVTDAMVGAIQARHIEWQEKL